MAKKLNVQNLKKENKKYSEKFEVEIREWKIEINKHFDKAEIGKIINKALNVMREVKTNEYDIDEVFAPYILLLAMKHFTSLGESMPEDFDSQLEVLRMLISEDLFVPILENFPKEESKKLFEEINQFSENLIDNIDSFDEVMKYVDLENNEILDSIDEKG